MDELSSVYVLFIEEKGVLQTSKIQVFSCPVLANITLHKTVDEIVKDMEDNEYSLLWTKDHNDQECCRVIIDNFLTYVKCVVWLQKLEIN